MKQLDRNHFELSTGRRFGANCGLISIQKHGDGTYNIGEGYDGGINIVGDADLYAEGPDYAWAKPWTPEERIELADFMLARWTEFRENVKESGTRAQAGHHAE